MARRDGTRKRAQTNGSASLMTLDEVCDLMQVSRKTVLKLREKHSLPCFRIGSVLRFDRDDVLRWLAARKEG